VGLRVGRSGETSSGGKKVSSESRLCTFFLFVAEGGGGELAPRPIWRLTRNMRIPFPADDLTAEPRSERMLRGAREKEEEEGVEGGRSWGGGGGRREAWVGEGEGERKGRGTDGDGGKAARLVEESDRGYCEDVESDDE
jgi:hypothetical protein